MSVIDVRRGDILPAVGIIQMLLNRAGASLTLDGNFGQHTQDAVKAFQRQRSISQTGQVDGTLFDRMDAGSELGILDSVDVTDPNLASMEVADITRAGGRVVQRAGMSNGVGQAIQDIVSQGSGLFLLRMHGHGAAGNIGMSDGRGIAGQHRTDLDQSTIAAISAELGRLRGVFGPHGCVQLMACNTGQGSQGRSLLRQLANIWNVPVSAGIQTQFAGGLAKSIRFEGPTVTECPGGKTLTQWLRGLPAFAGMSVA